MPTVSDQRTVAFPVDRIYRAVVDIESYPEKLAFIRAVEVLERQAERIRARVMVGLPGLNFSYECRIDCVENRSVEVSLISGPFKKLRAVWRFEAVGPNETRILYSLDSQFRNKLMELTAGAIFASQIRQSIAAFEAHLERS